MIAKTQEQREQLREAGRRMAAVVREVLAAAGPEVPSMELERVAREATERVGARASYLGYKEKSGEAYPAALCVSINNEIAHSPPKEGKILKAGDVVSIDFGLEYEGFYMDTAHTLVVGEADASAKNLLNGTQEALEAAIGVAKVGGHLGDISATVEKTAKKFRLGVVRDLRGHGVGGAVHEDPSVPNYGKAGEGEKIVDGLVIAIEPIFAEKNGAMVDDKDGHTYRTRDSSRAAHFEHTVLITKEGVEVLTALE